MQSMQPTQPTFVPTPAPVANPAFIPPPSFQQTTKKVQPAAQEQPVQPVVDPMLQDSVMAYPDAYPSPAPIAPAYPAYQDPMYPPPPPTWDAQAAPPVPYYPPPPMPPIQYPDSGKLE